MNSFFRCAAQLNTLRGVRQRYRSFSSDILLYFSFCELKIYDPSTRGKAPAFIGALYSNQGTPTAHTLITYVKLSITRASLLTGIPRGN